MTFYKWLLFGYEQWSRNQNQFEKIFEGNMSTCLLLSEDNIIQFACIYKSCELRIIQFACIYKSCALRLIMGKLFTKKYVCSIYVQPFLFWTLIMLIK